MTEEEVALQSRLHLKSMPDPLARLLSGDAGGVREPTVIAFGRQWTAEEFIALSADFLAMHRIVVNYAGESPAQWLRLFGLERAAVKESFARAIAARGKGDE